MARGGSGTDPELAFSPARLQAGGDQQSTDAMPSRRFRSLQAAWGLLALGMLAAAAPVRAEEVTAESIIDQASALRDASSRVPIGAQVLGSSCTDVALPGLSFRFRCSVKYTPAPERPAAPSQPAAQP